MKEFKFLMSAAIEKMEFQLPRRLRGLQPTLIRQFFERALPESINFGLGEPDLPTPDFMRREAARVAVEEQNGYTSHAGLIQLREKIAEQYPHLNLGPTDIVVTVGSQEAMTARWITGSLAGGSALSGVARSARSFQTNAVNKRDQLFAGAPARMPLKSSGKRCASIRASRPPSEQPSK